MAEYVEREALIKKMNEAPAYFDSGDIRYGIDVAIQQVIEQPAADVVKVIRCKDCKHRTNKGICEKFRQRYPFFPEDDFYCRFGELKEREGK